MSEGHEMDCQDARASIQAYLDGELNEERAGPLRKHLLDCQPCRGSAQSEKNLKRWFTKAKAPASNLVPRDFSARVARRAFAGDPGERYAAPELVMTTASVSTLTVASQPDERNLRFVLTLTAAAAVLLFVLSIAIRSLSLPSGSSMLAEPKITVEDARKQLDRLNLPAATATNDEKAPETRK